MADTTARRRALFGVAGLVLGLGTACYSAEFDEFADGLYSCGGDAECSEGYSCINGLCLEDVGPKVEFLGPEDLQPLADGTSMIPITVRADDLTLANPGDADTGSAGYVEIYLDGVLVGELNADSEGNIASGVALMADTGVVASGGHRLEARTFRPNGAQYDNPSSTGKRIFFVRNLDDDGVTNLPLIAILQPWPDQVVDGSEDLPITVATLNWEWIDSSIQNEGQEGHAHLYFDQPAYPDCQPGCNLLYRESMNPTSSEVVDAQTLRNLIGLREDEIAKGEVNIAVSLHNSDHTIFPEAPNPDDPEDPIREKLATDSLTILIEP